MISSDVHRPPPCETGKGVTMEQKRNYQLDFFKGIAAIGVVLVHFQFPGAFGSVMCSVGVAGVILFFLISGYFAYSEDNDKACAKLMSRFRRNLVITAAAVLIYFAAALVRELISGSFSEWITNFTAPAVYFRMFIMGDFELIHGDPLWFMPALLYSYLIIYCIHKIKISTLKLALLKPLLDIFFG